MPDPIRSLLNAAIEESDDEDAHLLENSDPREDPQRSRSRLHRTIGRIVDLAQHPSRWRAAVLRDPRAYQDLDQRTDAELESLGASQVRSAGLAAVSTGAGQLLAATNVPVLAQAPGIINAADTAEQARSLYSIANDFKDHNADDTRFKTTITNCAIFKSTKSGSQISSLVASAAVGTATTLAAAAVVATVGIAFPVVAITATAGLAGFGGGLGTRRGVAALFNLHFNVEQATRTLVDTALRPPGVNDDRARNAARAALQVLRLDLSRLNGIQPPGIDEEGSDEYRAVIELVKRLF